nr:MAG TPA: hypothetical protein [Caudoviricetes sp.]
MKTVYSSKSCYRCSMPTRYDDVADLLTETVCHS